MSKENETFDKASKEYLDNFKNEFQIIGEIRHLSYFINQLSLKLWHIRAEEQADAEAESDAEKNEDSTLTPGRSQEVESDSNDILSKVPY